MPPKRANRATTERRSPSEVLVAFGEALVYGGGEPAASDVVEDLRSGGGRRRRRLADGDDYGGAAGESPAQSP